MKTILLSITMTLLICSIALNYGFYAGKIGIASIEQPKSDYLQLLESVNKGE